MECEPATALSVASTSALMKLGIEGRMDRRLRASASAIQSAKSAISSCSIVVSSLETEPSHERISGLRSNSQRATKSSSKVTTGTTWA